MKKLEKPAFPIDSEAYGDSDLSGMSLRDWFAGLAMQGLIAQSNCTAIGSEGPIGAKFAYDMADAMMREREKLDTP